MHILQYEFCCSGIVFQAAQEYPSKFLFGHHKDTLLEMRGKTDIADLRRGFHSFLK